ncbi:electron transfer flavoprotein subunit beta/FixA family protein [Microcella sp.]|uniref:electron transfer flavoprotein subunit beta/FixA family protein n=1 Tax=Microcella sp. TaxID=1913979 RepID=UPI002566B0D6|nr:electron transfer flavoprotein subunit beta/FixA family protein [Microcella sp.]MBX9472380.1 electron transfer flavoprotein subunit beta/FixA family protein [Microcella sp.]
MKIVVLLKQVPDTWGERRLDLETGWLDRAASEAVIDESGERALELALAYRDAKNAAEITVMTMGPRQAADVLRKGLAMGADRAVHILDDALAGSDLSWTSLVLATAIKREGFDLVIAGNESTDGRGGVIPAMLAERLGVAGLGYLNVAELSDLEVRGERATEYGTADVHAALPAVISVTERAPEARFPSFRGIMQAKKKPLEVRHLADLGLNETARAVSVILNTAERPARDSGRKIVDDGTAGQQIADFLVETKLI